MKKLLTGLFFLAISSMGIAQPDTEIYVFELIQNGTDFSISEPFNVTYENPGYDNQPKFLPDGSMFYVSTKDGQTDVAQVEFQEYSWSWLTETSHGSEYSPTPLPNGDGYSYIRLDTNGTQMLYKQLYSEAEPTALFPDLKIGYHNWIDENTLAVFVLGEPSTLQVCYLQENACYIRDKNIGRSLLNIPNTSLISYVSKSEEPWQIKSHEPQTETTRKIVNALDGSEDLCWAYDGTMFMGKGDELYKFHAAFDREWVLVADLKEYGLSGITRLDISPDGNHIAIVVEQTKQNLSMDNDDIMEKQEDVREEQIEKLEDQKEDLEDQKEDIKDAKEGDTN